MPAHKTNKDELIGMEIGGFKVIRFDHSTENRITYYEVECITCGFRKLINVRKNRKIKTKLKCEGCKQIEIMSHIGEIYNRWKILEFVEINKFYEKVYKCQCECGTISNVSLSDLKSNRSVSCGCYRREISKELNTKHGLKDSRIYETYSSMKQRCYNPNNKSYSDYGGRGIYICEEWLNDFINFYNWSIENGYEEGLTIDRKDNDGPYSPWNCRWVNRTTQANNKRNNVMVQIFNQEYPLSTITNRFNVVYERTRRHVRDKGENIYDIINSQIDITNHINHNINSPFIYTEKRNTPFRSTKKNYK